MRRESLQLLPGIAAVGITQIIGWGSTFHLPGVLGETIAADLEQRAENMTSGQSAA